MVLLYTVNAFNNPNPQLVAMKHLAKFALFFWLPWGSYNNNLSFT